jgi:hypothetical protein
MLRDLVVGGISNATVVNQALSSFSSPSSHFSTHPTPSHPMLQERSLDCSLGQSDYLQLLGQPDLQGGGT